MARRPRKKSDDAFRTISEVAETLDVPQHVLRFWETKFKQLSPMKRAGGRRYYSPEDVDILKKIHFLLYTKGYTIKGAHKLLSQSDNLANELMGISEHFSLKTEPAPKDLIKSTTLKADKSESPLFADENEPRIDRAATLADLKDLLSTLKDLQADINRIDH